MNYHMNYNYILQTVILMMYCNRSESWLFGLSKKASLLYYSPSFTTFTSNYLESYRPKRRSFNISHQKLLLATPQNESNDMQATTDKSKTSHVKTKAKGATSKQRRTPIEISASSSNTKQIKRQSNLDGDDMNHAYNIPTTGVSLADSMKGKEEFITTLTPILDVGTNGENEADIIYNDEGRPIGVKKNQRQNHDGVARIDTVSTSGNVGEEPVRWLVSLDDPSKSDNEYQSYFLIDIPPYSDQLADKIKTFMNPNHSNTKGDKSRPKGRLDAILVTNQECIHYDQSPGVYVTRKSDLEKWKTAFPEVNIIIYRLDQPRECRESVTQVLDGYGPWAWDVNSSENVFVETGRPLRIEEWDEATASNVLNFGETPPDDSNETKDKNTATEDENDDIDLYSKESIRQREGNYDLLAVYTPGHTFGSVTYIFPKRGICCSGYALPLESASGDIDDEGDGETYSGAPIAPQGPRLDYQGYLATSVSRSRQMSSASKLISDYIDRFSVVLPARGDVVFLEGDADTRKRDLMENIGLYRKISEIYGRLGIAE